MTSQQEMSENSRREAATWLAAQQAKTDQANENKVCGPCIKKAFRDSCGGEITSGSCLRRVTRHKL